MLQTIVIVNSWISMDFSTFIYTFTFKILRSNKKVEKSVGKNMVNLELSHLLGRNVNGVIVENSSVVPEKLKLATI